jgi:hypothetical protein
MKSPIPSPVAGHGSLPEASRRLCPEGLLPLLALPWSNPYLCATGHEIADEDLKRLTPLQHEHIKMLGNFPFTLPCELAAGQRRPLRGLGDRA